MGINANALAGKLREILLKKIAAGGLALPPLPETLTRIQDHMKGVGGGRAMHELLAQDPVLALEVVRRAAALGRSRRTPPRSLQQAIDILGPQGMRRVLSATGGLALYKSRSADIRERCEELWQGSVAVGTTARRIALMAGMPEPDEAQLAGLMHGVGRPVAGIMLLELERAIARHHQSHWIDVGTWLSIIEHVQAPVGAAIAESWHMSQEIREAVCGGIDFDAGNRHSLSNAVRMAHAMATIAGLFHGGDMSEAQTMLVIGRSILGLKTDAVDAVQAELLAAA